MSPGYTDLIADFVRGAMKAHATNLDAKLRQLAEANGGVLPCSTCGDTAAFQLIGPVDTDYGIEDGKLVITEQLRFACDEHRGQL